MSKHWEVVGGGDSGGILVREGKELQSKAMEWRLKTGSLLMQVEAAEDRVHYYLVMGEGPGEGWVSIKTKSGALLKERDISTERWFQATKEFRSKRKDPEALKQAAWELLGLQREDQQLKGAFLMNGVLEAGVSALKNYPADVELQGALVELLGDICLFNEYAMNKAGRLGAMEGVLGYFKNNASDPDVQAKLGQLGCFLDYSEDNRKYMAAYGGFHHAFNTCRLHNQNENVVFAALCAASNPTDHPDDCFDAGAPEVLAQVFSNFRFDDRVLSEAGMVAKGLLHSHKGTEAAELMGKCGLSEAFTRATREHLGSRPMQANGSHCMGLLARVPENRKAVLKAGGIDVLLAIIQDSVRCMGVCWGLVGFEDRLWRVLDNCSEALMYIGKDSPESLTAMVKAGAIDILKAALEHEGPNPFAQEAVRVLEEHCAAHPTLGPELRTDFVGSWIQNKRPVSAGIFTFARDDKGGYSITTDAPGDDQVWNTLSITVSGNTVNVVEPEEFRSSGVLEGGVIRWSPELWFYPWQPLEE